MKKTKARVPRFLLIPGILILDKSMKAADNLVYGAIYSFSNSSGTGKCFASNQYLAEMTNLSPQTVANSLVRLEEKKYVLRIFKDKSKKIRKEIVPMIDFSHNKEAYSTEETEENVYSAEETSIPHKVNDVYSAEEHISNSNYKESINIFTDKSVRDDKEKEEKKKPTNEVNQILDLVKKKSLVPSSFTNKKKNPFAIPTIRAGVEAVISAHGFESVKATLEGYAKRRDEQFAPRVGNIQQLFEYKFESIRAFLGAKPASPHLRDYKASGKPKDEKEAIGMEFLKTNIQRKKQGKEKLSWPEYYEENKDNKEILNKYEYASTTTA
jgi:DNA-binding Lrp family transcriptional regulator